VKHRVPLLAHLALLLCVATTAAEAKTYAVYYLGGQSNMDGFGSVSELPDDLDDPVDGVYIFHGNTGKDAEAVDGIGTWAVLRPGHGVSFTSDGESAHYSDRFGVEITFARRLQELNPKANIAIIKYSRSGTSIDLRSPSAQRFGAWDPDYEGGAADGQGINQYDHFLATLRNAFSDPDIDDDGEIDVLIPAGIVWMQGESDASPEPVAEAYAQNLRRLMNLIRAALRQDDLPVVIGRISDSMKDGHPVWEFGDTVRAAQAEFCEQDGHAALVTSTDDYAYSDPWHYDTQGYIDLGRQFADAMHQLETGAP
jgi:hypothetical protein